MSAWVCSAKKFVVSSFVSFAEELENVVLVLTDADENADQASSHGQKPSPIRSSDADNTIKAGLSTLDATAANGIDGNGDNANANTNVFLLDTKSPALTTQPEPSAARIVSATTPMTSHMNNTMTSSEQTSSSSSLSFTSSIPISSRSLNDFNSRSSSDKRFVPLSSPMNTNTNTSMKSPTSHRFHSHLSRTSHIPYVHRYRPSPSRHPVVVNSQTDLPQDTMSSPLNQLPVQSISPTSISTVVVGSKRMKEMSILNLKMPGKVIRAYSTTEESGLVDEDEEEEKERSGCGLPGGAGTGTISIHVIGDSSDLSQGQGHGHMDDLQQMSLLAHHNSSPSTPEDVSIPNRCIQPADYAESHIDLIQRVSLVDRFTQILHSTLLTISNLLRLELEDEDITTILCRNRRSLQLQAQANEPDRENRPVGEQAGTNYQDPSSSHEQNDYVGIVNNSNLTLSRINSLVSLESFEVLSKENNDTHTTPTTDESISDFNNPSYLFHNSQCESPLPEKLHHNIAIISNNNEHEYSDIQMNSSIEFIHFEVSDLITKRYFDSKTQRLTSIPTSLDMTSQRLDPIEAKEGEKEEFDHNQTITTDCCQPQAGEIDSNDEAQTTVVLREDDDGSSASFDIIYEDACDEPFDIL